jgi:hypothetical protein
MNFNKYGEFKDSLEVKTPLVLLCIYKQFYHFNFFFNP